MSSHVKKAKNRHYNGHYRLEPESVFFKCPGRHVYDKDPLWWHELWPPFIRREGKIVWHFVKQPHNWAEGGATLAFKSRRRKKQSSNACNKKRNWAELCTRIKNFPCPVGFVHYVHYWNHFCAGNAISKFIHKVKMKLTFLLPHYRWRI